MEVYETTKSFCREAVCLLSFRTHSSFVALSTYFAFLSALRSPCYAYQHSTYIMYIGGFLSASQSFPHEFYRYVKSSTFCFLWAVVAQSVLRWATGWTIGVLEFDSRRGLGIFLFTTASRTALGPTQPPIQWIPRALSLGIKRPGREADHSPPSSAEVKECVELYLHSPNTPSWRGA
jgi:hypothetical protein